MPWFKVDDKLHSHRKSARAGTAAMGLWVLAGSWCMEHLTDGFVPDSAARRLDPDARELASALVTAGLWTEAEQDGEAGWQFHGWHDFQPTRESVEAQRQAARDRMARVRGKSPHSAPAVRANSEGTSDSPVPVPVVPTELDTTAGGGDFDAFWTEYPRKVGKAAAAKAYGKATKSTDPATILDGLRNAVQVWTASRTEDRFIPHASTWLNAGRWADEVPLPSMPERNPADTLRPAKTLAQCDGTDCPGSQHEWTDRHARATYVCMGA